MLSFSAAGGALVLFFLYPTMLLLMGLSAWRTSGVYLVVCGSRVFVVYAWNSIWFVDVDGEKGGLPGAPDEECYCYVAVYNCYLYGRFVCFSAPPLLVITCIF